jgi:hypothetical protein
VPETGGGVGGGVTTVVTDWVTFPPQPESAATQRSVAAKSDEAAAGLHIFDREELDTEELVSAATDDRVA